MHTQLNKPWSNTIPMLAHTHNIIISSHGCTSTHRHSRMVTRYACNRIIQHNININLNSFLTYANLRTPTKMQLGHYFIRMCHKLHNIGKFLIDKQPLQTLSVTILWHVSQDAFLFLFSQNQRVSQSYKFPSQHTINLQLHGLERAGFVLRADYTVLPYHHWYQSKHTATSKGCGQTNATPHHNDILTAHLLPEECKKSNN